MNGCIHLSKNRQEKNRYHVDTLDFVSGLHSCLEFSQPLSCLYQTMQTRKTFPIAEMLYNLKYIG